MPVDGRDLIEPILDEDARRLALAQAQWRTRHGPIVSPDVCIGAGGAREPHAGRPRGEVIGVFRRNRQRRR